MFYREIQRQRLIFLPQRIKLFSVNKICITLDISEIIIESVRSQIPLSSGFPDLKKTAERVRILIRVGI